MQELSQEIRQVTEESFVSPGEHLRETAKKWASYVLEKNTGETLRKGLEISRRIADYLNELDDIG